MNNAFDDALPQILLISGTRAGSQIDVNAVRLELARWVGWYRKESAEGGSLKVQHEEVTHLVGLLMELHKRLETPNGTSPGLRVRILENMSHLKTPMPQFARLAGCVQNAGEQLTPIRTGPRKDYLRDNAIRNVFLSLLQHSTPRLGVTEARSFAAELVGDSLGIDCPSDSKELRRITGGN